MNKEINLFVNGKEISNVQISLDEATIIDSIDKTIIAVSEKIQVGDLYADAVKALAALVEARAKLV